MRPHGRYEPLGGEGRLRPRPRAPVRILHREPPTAAAAPGSSPSVRDRCGGVEDKIREHFHAGKAGVSRFVPVPDAAVKGGEKVGKDGGGGIAADEDFGGLSQGLLWANHHCRGIEWISFILLSKL